MSKVRHLISWQPCNISHGNGGSTKFPTFGGEARSSRVIAQVCQSTDKAYWVVYVVYEVDININKTLAGFDYQVSRWQHPRGISRTPRVRDVQVVCLHLVTEVRLSIIGFRYYITLRIQVMNLLGKKNLHYIHYL